MIECGMYRPIPASKQRAAKTLTVRISRRRNRRSTVATTTKIHR